MRFASLTVCACVCKYVETYIRDIVNFTAFLLLFSSTLAFYFLFIGAGNFSSRTHTHNLLEWVNICLYLCVVLILLFAMHLILTNTYAYTHTHQHISIYSLHSWLQFTVAAAFECMSDDSRGQNICTSSPPSRLHCTGTARTKCLVFCFDVVGQTCLFAQNKI